MTVYVETMVHCDHENCGEWVHTTDAGGNSNLGWRRAMGWTMNRSNGRRLDFCPKHPQLDTGGTR